MRARTIELRIDSRLDDVFLIGLAVNRICSHCAIGEVEAYQLEVCVVEGVNNAIKHAYGEQPGHEVRVLLSLLTDRVEIEIRDRGRSMRRAAAESPRLEFDPGDLESLPEGGMGLFIMNDIMDELVYETQDGENVLRLVKRLERVEADSAKVPE